MHQKISHNTPEYKKHQSEIMKEIASRPGLLERRNKAISEGKKGKHHSDAHKHAISQGMKHKWSEIPKDTLLKIYDDTNKRMKKYFESPESRAKHSKATSEGKKGKTHSESHKNAISESMKLLANNNPDTIKKRNSAIGIGIKKFYEDLLEDPILYMKHWESKGQIFWASGQIIDKQLPNYCELWKDVNPRVHNFFDYKCVECGIPENGRSHIGHHVFYVKKACCWYNDEGIYYTNLNAKDHKEHDYCIGKNPNYFVILCPKCHGKTNGKFANRMKWANHFKEMIDTKYGGKCYFTKEEMGE